MHLQLLMSSFFAIIKSGISGGKRHPALYGHIPLFESAPKKTLTEQLRELEEDGVLERTVIPTVPVQVEYTVIDFGKTLFPLLDAMCDWGYEHLDSEKYELMHPTSDGDAQQEK